MSTPRPIVEVAGVGKRYRLGNLGTSSLREMVGSLFRGRHSTEQAVAGPRAGDLPGTFWSLKDVNFSVKRGEIVGLVGRNGAGKSTLLKLISRITEPTRGRITLRGRIASLLEVGTGFHPELTGRENIFLNGAILGMKKWEISRHFDEIVAFAEVGEFLDTPVKRYSSGMFVRLAFAVAAHLEPEVLLIDEVLAVGDAGFQQKCLGKMSEVATEGGRTVFFVSHNLGAVRTLCTRAILLHDGTIAADGSPEGVIADYMSRFQPEGTDTPGHAHWGGGGDAPGTSDFRLHSFTLTNARGEISAIYDATEPIHAELKFRVLEPIRGARTMLNIFTTEGEIAFSATDHSLQPPVIPAGLHTTRWVIPGGLLNRRAYSACLSCDAPGFRNLLSASQHIPFTVGGPGNHLSQFPERWPGIVCPRIECSIEHSS